MKKALGEGFSFKAKVWLSPALGSPPKIEHSFRVGHETGLRLRFFVLQRIFKACSGHASTLPSHSHG